MVYFPRYGFKQQKWHSQSLEVIGFGASARIIWRFLWGWNSGWHGEHELITRVWGGPKTGSKGKDPGQGVTGKASWSWKFFGVWTSKESDKFASFRYFLSKLRVFIISVSNCKHCQWALWWWQTVLSSRKQENRPTGEHEDTWRSLLNVVWEQREPELGCFWPRFLSVFKGRHKILEGGPQGPRNSILTGAIR